MKSPKLLDQVLVAAMLLAYVPGLADDALTAPDPVALIAPAAQEAAESTEEESSLGL